MSKAKPFCISKQEVWEAYKRVKANKGAAGVDEQSIADFEKRLKPNLYKIWNRMSSGSYFPPPVRTVKIPKANGGERKLGIPTVSDRIAQMVVKSRLERHWTQWGRRGSDIGALTGSSIWTSRASSTTLTKIY